MTTDHTFCHNSQDLALQELTKNQSVRLICQPQNNHRTEKSENNYPCYLDIFIENVYGTLALI